MPSLLPLGVRALEVDLPFEFLFYDQLKNHMKISSNGYVTFSGEDFAWGNSFPIPQGGPPNDLIAPFWTDFDPSRAPSGQGEVYTKHMTGANCMQLPPSPFVSIPSVCVAMTMSNLCWHPSDTDEDTRSLG